jgi:hypothetical protein
MISTKYWGAATNSQRTKEMLIYIRLGVVWGGQMLALPPPSRFLYVARRLFIRRGTPGDLILTCGLQEA